MIRFTVRCRAALVLSALFVGAVHLTAIAAQPIPADAIERIDKALPAAATAAPEAPRRLLVFTLTKGFRHASIPYGAEAIARMGAKAGAYEAVVSDDAAMFERASLEQFDAVLFLSTTGTLFDDTALKQNLLDFVRGGKGVIGIHAATDCFYDWPEFGAMMGGYFLNHPWNEAVTITVEEPDHALCGAFADDSFVIADEIYQFRAEPYSRERLRVVLSLDTSQTDMNKPGIERADGDFGVSWIQSFGDGRVFYCSLGHREEIYWNPVVLQHYLDGIQFALGDLEADATPSARLNRNQDRDAGNAATRPANRIDRLDGLFEKLAGYQFGASRAGVSAIDREITLALDDEALRSAMEQRLIAIITSETSTAAAKDFASRRLAFIGGPASVAALASLLHDDRLAHPARAALEIIDEPEATQALLNALLTTEGPALVGVLSTLGRRGESDTLTDLIRVGLGGDDEVRIAAMNAAAEIGGGSARDLIVLVRNSAEDKERVARAATDALLRAAEKYLTGAGGAAASEIYQPIYDAANTDDASDPDADSARSDHLRFAALRGIVTARPRSGVELLMTQLAGEDALERRNAARIIAGTDGPAITEALAARLPELPPDGRIALIEALAARGDGAARDAVTREIQSSDQRVRFAAVNALGELGDASTVAILAPMTIDAHPDVREAALASLNRLHGEKIDFALAEAMVFASPELRAMLVRMIGERDDFTQTEALYKVFNADSSEAVRTVVMNALAKLADPADFPRLVRMLSRATTNELRAAGVDCLARVGAQLDPDVAAGHIIAASDASVGPNKAALISTLGRIGGDAALAAVRSSLRDPDLDIRAAAVEALASWPGPESLDTLFEIISGDPDLEASRSAALRGYFNLIDTLPELSTDERLARLEAAAPLLRDDDERVALLGSAGRIPSMAALQFAESFASTEFNTAPTTNGAHQSSPVNSAVAHAMINIASSIPQLDDTAAAIEAVEGALALAPGDASVYARAGAAMNQIEHHEGFITDWLIAGPFATDELSGADLFDTRFPPEPPDDWDGDGAPVAPIASTVEWRPAPPAVYTSPGVIDLRAATGSDASDQCVYLRSVVIATDHMDARLEIGSDDGVKIWVERALIHANNVMRGLAIGQDVVSVTLQPGDNEIIMKVTQGAGDWKACLRIRRADGFSIQRLD